VLGDFLVHCWLGACQMFEKRLSLKGVDEMEHGLRVEVE
jgi:hypothetical protein